MSCEASTVVLCSRVSACVHRFFVCTDPFVLLYCDAPSERRTVELNSQVPLQLRSLSFERFRSLCTLKTVSVTERYAPRSRYRIPSVEVNDYTTALLDTTVRCYTL